MPDTKLTKVDTYYETWPCPMAGCDGQMAPTGFVFDTLPPDYMHACSKCSHSECSEVKYPKITYKPVDL